MAFSMNMENFKEFFVLPDDAHDQVKVTWTPKENVGGEKLLSRKER